MKKLVKIFSIVIIILTMMFTSFACVPEVVDEGDEEKVFHIQNTLEDIQAAGVSIMLTSCAVGISLRMNTLYSEILSLGT